MLLFPLEEICPVRVKTPKQRTPTQDRPVVQNKEL